VGFVADGRGKASRKIVELGLAALARLEHRGGLGADGRTSDGAGLMTAIPWPLLEPWLAEQRLAEPRPFSTAVGMLFLPREPGKRRLGRELVAKVLRDEGLVVAGWRKVPVCVDALPAGSRDSHPIVEQVVATSPSLSGEELERVLLLARRRIGAALARQPVIKRFSDLYVCSLSTRTIVYKGMVTSDVLPAFYADLQNEAYASPFALFHRRFSTNSEPRWNLAQPMRLLAHNGEINTLLGNLAWTSAREADLAAPAWGARVAELLPVLHRQGSDSGALDKFIELLVRSGRSPLEALMLTMPEAFEGRDDLDGRVAAFYDYYAGVQEAWDGPAMVAFSDGRVVGACLDRNGLRPARYLRSASGVLAVASEAGAVPVDDKDIIERGRLGPGEMIAVDLYEGRLLRDRTIKEAVAARLPYARWLAENRLRLLNAPPATPRPTVAEADLLCRQTAAGFTAEDVELIVRPMADEAREPRYAMGNDTPLAILSGKPHTLYDYFCQRFAQVTNPPIDPLRERLVMSLSTRLGRRRNLLAAGPDHARQLELTSPILDDDQMAALVAGQLRVTRISTAYAVETGPWGLREALERICRQAARAARDGAEIVVLNDSDEPVCAERSHVPPLLATGAVHHHLAGEGLRARLSLVVQSAQCWTVHHYACLIGYGAAAVHPHLALATVRDLWERGRLDRSERPDSSVDSAAAAESRYRSSVEQGLLKVLSKLGISLLASYQGAQLFEALGLGSDLVELGFLGTPSRIGGLSVEELAQETISIHHRAFPELTLERLADLGFVRYRQAGEYHINNPDAAKALRRACIEGSTDLYERYCEMQEGRPPTTLRDLLRVCDDTVAVPVREVEPVEALLARFCTGGMSLGALSREAHETIAVAMRRIGGRGNSGEGGEDPERDRAIDDVDAGGRSAHLPHLRGLRAGDDASSQIRQVASGRFGVTCRYLATAEQLEIKIAQGAKPGEGGELPGEKVTTYVASLRRAAEGTTLISPPPHHDIYSIEDLAELIYDLRQVNPAAEISVKLVAGSGVGTIAAGVAKAGADIVHISGQGGGTAAAALTSIKHAGLPWELGLAEVQQVLREAGLRDRVRLRVDGDLRTGRDVLMAALLGADEFAFGTGVLLACGCVIDRQCHRNTCPVGIATQRDDLRARFAGRPEHIENYFRLVADEVRELLANLGCRTLGEVVGRVDLLDFRAVELTKTDGLDGSWLPVAHGLRRTSRQAATPGVPVSAETVETKSTFGEANGAGFDECLLADPSFAGSLRCGRPLRRRLTVANKHRAIGAGIAGEIARRGTRDRASLVHLELEGSAGQSLGAFCTGGMRIDLCGEANDYVGKGMSGGEIALRPRSIRRMPAHGQGVIAGNTCLYGATGGALFAAGSVGERFAVRNSGARAVVEGTGDHCCEYMTGGVVVVLGPTGRNPCAGMTGGTAYFLVEEPSGWIDGNSTVVFRPLDCGAKRELSLLLQLHVENTGSQAALRLLADEDFLYSHIVRVRARESAVPGA
jgi:glutamate synthase (ferredoxin)